MIGYSSNPEPDEIRMPSPPRLRSYDDEGPICDDPDAVADGYIAEHLNRQEEP